jgi:hypothetical protein
MPLHVTSTNAGDDSEGSVWGIQGDNLLVLLVALVVAIGFALVLHARGAGPLVVLAGAPLGIASAYIFLLRQGKPPAYDLDWLEAQCLGGDWQPDVRQPSNPIEL